MKFLIGVGIWLGISAVVGAIVFFSIFYKMIFVSDITERKVRKEKDFTILLDGVTIEEIAHDQPPLEPDWNADGGDVPGAREILLTPDNRLEDGRRVMDGDPRREVLQLDGYGDRPARIFIDQDIYVRSDDRLGEKIADFQGGPFDRPRYVGGINGDWFLLVADLKDRPQESGDTGTRLWQVDHASLAMQVIDKQPYYTFERPPKTFTPDGFSGVILAIYHGDVSYGYGGDSSRPASTVLRAYTPQYPMGVNLVRFAFKAGTVVEVDWQENALLVTGDPSRPRAANKPRLPPRIWKLSLPADFGGESLSSQASAISPDSKVIASAVNN